MNMPFNPRQHIGRQLFSGFLCDEQSSKALSEAASELGWPAGLISTGGLRNAVQTLAVTSSPSILVIDLSESPDPLNDIGALAEVCEPGTVVIAIGTINDVRFYRDLVGSGIHDYLLKPLNPDHIRDVMSQAQLMLSGARAAEKGSARPHGMVAFTGTRGGVGTSSILTSVAWLLSEGRGLIDAIENPGRIDSLYIERAMMRANPNLAVLSAETPLSNPMLTDGAAFFQLQHEMKQAFEFTLVDLPRHMLTQSPQLLGEVQTLVLATELTLAGTRDTLRMLSWLKSQAPQLNVLVVANKVPASDPEISRKDFEHAVERAVDVCIPLNIKVAVQAAKLGKTMAELAPGEKMGNGFDSLAAELVTAITGEEEATMGAAPSLLGRIASLRDLLPRKAKAA